MPSREEIQQRLRDLLVAEFDRRVVEASRRLPKSCVHHVEHRLDARRSVGDDPNPDYNRVAPHGLPVLQTIGLCGLNIDKAEEWNGTICEEPQDAQRCPYFTAKWDKSNLMSAFKANFSDPEWVRCQHPAVGELLWVLGTAPKLPWWRKALFWIKRIPVEPLKPPMDINRFLGTGQE